MKVFKEPCKNCLLTPDRIVSSARAKEILSGCIQKQQHFICHKATFDDEGNGEDICCSTFYTKMGQCSNLIRIMERIGGIKFVEQPAAEKLTPYRELHKKLTIKEKKEKT